MSSFLFAAAAAVLAVPAAWAWYRWKYSSIHKPIPAPGKAALRIMTYNVLADGPRYALSSKHSKYCPLQFLEWSYRSPFILKQLTSFQADVIMLQETQYTTMVSTFWPALSPAYHVLHSTPYEGAQFALEMTKASFLRRDKLEVLRHSFVMFRKEVEATFAVLGISLTSALADVMFTRHDSCEIMILRDITTSKPICVVNTHLFFNPRHPDVKVLQAFIMMQSIFEFIEDFIAAEATTLTLATFPIVIAGDFNSLAVKATPDEFDAVREFPAGGLVSGVYTLISTGVLEPSHPEHPSSRAGVSLGRLTSPLPALTSAYKRLRGADPPITTRVTDFDGTIDFIFVSDAVTVLEALPLPYEATHVDQYPPIPTATQPSDHLPLGVDISF